MSERLYKILSEHLTERKRDLFEQVVSQRTRYFTLVLEDIYQAQNASALLRSAEAWGVQDLHIIENRHTFQHHRKIAKGAKDWLTIKRYNKMPDNSAACFETLKSNGYQIIVTALQPDAITLDQIDLNKKTAVVMGTELTGASTTALKYADATMVIPMHGFTESLNVSVAAAVILQNITHRLRKLEMPWQLSAEEQLALKIDWAKKSIYWSDYLVEMFETGELQ
jgi:tRNA (guanosine-2'-O-)-methyltransferase